MELTIDLPRARAMAKSLRASLGAYNVTSSAAYEALALALGYPNWDTLSGMLNKETPTKPCLAHPAHEAPAPRLVEQPFVLLLNAFACDEWGESPDFAVLDIDERVAQEILRARDMVRAQGLTHAELDFSAHQWSTDFGDAFSLNLRGDALQAWSHTWLLTARPKHSNYNVETRAVSYENFDALLAGKALPTGFVRFALKPEQGKPSVLVVQVVTAGTDEQVIAQAWDLAEGYCDKSGRELANTELPPAGLSQCDSCDTQVETIVGCPDGSEVCRSCFDSGAH